MALPNSNTRTSNASSSHRSIPTSIATATPSPTPTAELVSDEPIEDIAQQIDTDQDQYATPFNTPPPSVHEPPTGWELCIVLDDECGLLPALDFALPPPEEPDPDSYKNSQLLKALDISEPPLQDLIPKSLKRYKCGQPSRFCHICGRKVHNVRVAACGLVLSGLCRKVICAKCLDSHYPNDNAPVGEDTAPSWKCTHCRGICTPKAQCNVYGKSNHKRHLALLEKRRSAEQ